ncbi:uncharacterized protein PGRI_010100 [Penicillium griseofulvum]|uniref:Uncharacterized protein n=1 Tax=Penicillium patulum TaxID=5078 RepID=A0A135LYC7_PENPA|nr:uncharacterized protein PGRI_010100 [Penicillium griseofulvum]KXG53960.1 hypothetical protein PGRI_010100 [Penicillium griseofulvum]
MEPANNQLARPLAEIRYTRGTIHVSCGNDRLCLAYMHPWYAFLQDVRFIFHGHNFNHEIPLNDETEPDTVGNELGLTGRFVCNLCDPVIKAITPLLNMAGLTFADIQALAYTEDVIPDVCLGIVSSRANIDNVLMVGGIETPWTTRLQNMRLSNLGHALGNAFFQGYCLSLHKQIP